MDTPVKQDSARPTGYIIWALVAFLTLAVYVLTRSRALFWDEVPYHSRVEAFFAAPSLRDWLLDNAVVPAGPLHALMFAGLANECGTLGVPWVRLPNLVLLAATIAIAVVALRRAGARTEAALGVLAVPMAWVVTGLALTEPLAILGLTVAMAGTLVWASDDDQRFAWPGLVLLALGVAVATTTRQTSAAAVPGLWLMAVRSRRDLVPTAAAIVLGLIPLAMAAWTWGGLVPPRLAFTGRGIVLRHAFLACALSGVIVAILAPRIYWTFRRSAGIAAAVAIAANLAFGFVQPTTLTSVQRLIGFPGLCRLAERLAAAAFVGAGGAFVMVLVWVLRRSPGRTHAGAVFAVAALCAACAGVTHQFSSRYALMSLPFLLLVLAPWMDFGPWAIVRSAVGSVVGLAILHSYFVFA